MVSVASALIRAETVKRWHNRCSVSVVVSSLTAAPAAATLVGAGDPGSSRLVYAMVIGLAAVGVALVALAIWIIRQTRTDLEVLAPLERMGDGDWRKRDPSTQRRMLDEVRPEGATPLSSEPMPPPLDDEFEADHPVSSFSDLGPGISNDSSDPTPLDLGANEPVGAVPAGDEEPDPVAATEEPAREDSTEAEPVSVDDEVVDVEQPAGDEQPADDEVSVDRP